MKSETERVQTSLFFASLKPVSILRFNLYAHMKGTLKTRPRLDFTIRKE